MKKSKSRGVASAFLRESDFFNKFCKKLKRLFSSEGPKYIKYRKKFNIKENYVLFDSQHGNGINGNMFYNFNKGKDAKKTAIDYWRKAVRCGNGTAAYEMGVNPGVDPFMTLSFMALTVIPTLRMTTRGVFDVNQQKYV